jgi:DNA-binding IclR family transcriptional regulator
MSTSEGEGHPSLIDRVFCVLESCAASGRPLTLVDLSRRTGLPKTTVRRVCWKLEQLGLLSHVQDGFQVSEKLFALGSMSPTLRRLRAISMPLLYELSAKTGWSSSLAVLAEGSALVVEEVYGRNTRQLPRLIGANLPLHATAIGKALLSGFSDAELDRFLGEGPLEPFTQATIVRPDLLREQLDRIRVSAVVQACEEWAPGACGVASLVYSGGKVVAAVGVAEAPGDPAIQLHAQYVRVVGSRLTSALNPGLKLVAA